MLNSTSGNNTGSSWMDIPPCVTDKLPPLSFSSSSNRLRSTMASDGMASYRERSRDHLSRSANMADEGMSLCCSSTVLRHGLVHQLTKDKHTSYESNSATNGLLLLKQEIPGSGFPGCYDEPVHTGLLNLNHLSSRSGESDRFSLRCGTNRSFSRTGSSFGCRSCENKTARSGDLCAAADSCNRVPKRRDPYDLSSRIIQSRQNFQCALDSACRDSSVDVGLKVSTVREV